MGKIALWVSRQIAAYVVILAVLATSHYFNASDRKALRDEYCSTAFALKKSQKRFDDYWGGFAGRLRRLGNPKTYTESLAELKVEAARADVLWLTVQDIEPDAIRDGYCDRLRDSPRGEQTASFPRSVAEKSDEAILWWLVLLLSPYLFRAFLYHVLAPSLHVGEPISVAKGDGSGARPSRESKPLTGKISQGTLQLELESGHTALIKPQFVRSADAALVKGTMWHLDWRRPMTGVAAGLNALSKYQPRNGETAHLTLIPAINVQDELAIVDVAPGQAMVVYPRAIVGVVVPDGSPVTIKSHWRLTSLQAWLTLSLRLLTFHGPIRIIVQGCKGVTLEMAGPGLQIHRAATIAYSTELSLSCRRTEPFGAYLMNQQPLFEDNFQTTVGAQGFVVAEVVPRGAGGNGEPSKGMDAVLEVLQKALGI